MTINPSQSPAHDIYTHDDGDFSIAHLDARAMRAVDYFSGYLGAFGGDAGRARELMARPCRQHEFIDHMRNDHGATLAAAAAAAHVSVEVAQRLRDTALKDSPVALRNNLDGPERHLVNLISARMPIPEGVVGAERYINRRPDLSSLIDDLDDAPNAILDALSEGMCGKRTFAEALTGPQLSLLVGRVTGIDPATLTPVDWFGSGMRAIVTGGGAFGLDLMNADAFHSKSGRWVKVPVVTSGTGYPARQVNYRIGTEQDWVLVWHYHTSVLETDGAPILVLHDNAAGNESDALMLACAFQGSIPLPCRNPAENITEDVNRRTKDWLPRQLLLHDIPARLAEARQILPAWSGSRVQSLRRSPLQIYMAGFTHFKVAMVQANRTIDYMGIEVMLTADLPPGSLVVAGIRPENLLAVGRQPCAVIAFDFDLDLPRDERGRLRLGKGITRFQELGRTEAVWHPGRGLEPQRGSFMEGANLTDTRSRLEADLALHLERFPVRRLRPADPNRTLILPPGLSVGIDAGAERGDQTSLLRDRVEDAQAVPAFGQATEAEFSGMATSPAGSASDAPEANPMEGSLKLAERAARPRPAIGPDATQPGSESNPSAEDNALPLVDETIRMDDPSVMEEPTNGITTIPEEPASPIALDTLAHSVRVAVVSGKEAQHGADQPGTTAWQLIPGLVGRGSAATAARGSADLAGSLPETFDHSEEAALKLPAPPVEAADADLAAAVSGPEQAPPYDPGRKGCESTVAVDAEARLQKFGVDVDGHIELGQKPEDGDALTPVELRRRSRLEIPYVRLNRTAGRVAPFPGAVGERMLREGGVDPQVVSDWLARCPFNIGYERWYG
ncbi:MAG: hypothetical protein ACR2MY_14945, partial [Candidatus Dormibacteria bacterium]